MREAIVQAKIGEEHGDIPIGAVAVRNGEAIGTGYNTRHISNDPTGHAEINALRRATEHLGSWHLEDVTLYVTLEPCPMCAGALWASRIGEVVFGVPDPKAGALGTLYHLGADPRLNHEFEVRSGVLAAECAALLTDFFQSRRNDRSTPSGHSTPGSRQTA